MATREYPDRTVKADLSAASEGDLLTVQADGTVAPASGTSTTVYVGAPEMHNTFGSPSRGDIGNDVAVWLLDASSIEQLSGYWSPPDGWATYDMELVWANAGAGSGDVVWGGRTYAFSAGSDASTGVLLSNVTDTAGAQNIVQVVTMASGVAVPADDGLAAFNVSRRASDGADTLGNDAAVLAMRFTKAS